MGSARAMVSDVSLLVYFSSNQSKNVWFCGAGEIWYIQWNKRLCCDLSWQMAMYTCDTLTKIFHDTLTGTGVMCMIASVPDMSSWMIFRFVLHLYGVRRSALLYYKDIIFHNSRQSIPCFFFFFVTPAWMYRINVFCTLSLNAALICTRDQP